MRIRFTPILLALLAGCSAPLTMPDGVNAEGPAPDVLMLGEQHDAPDHQAMHSRVVKALAGRGVLAAVVLEMAERGHSTAGLPAQASEAQVRQALHWNEAGWPWAPYQPAVMAAVAAGIPVLGGNLPRPQLREARNDAQLDAMLPGPALKAQQQAIRQGHCDLLPESQIGPMTRMQIARDRSLAQTLEQAAVPGKTVLLLAGGRHIDEALGVPQHLPSSLRVVAAPLPPRPQQKDYCADLERQMKPRTGA
ncbi:MAG: ChaN family lipoprotein [Ramlibacter sp.]